MPVPQIELRSPAHDGNVCLAHREHADDREEPLDEKPVCLVRGFPCHLPPSTSTNIDSCLYTWLCFLKFSCVAPNDLPSACDLLFIQPWQSAQIDRHGHRNLDARHMAVLFVREDALGGSLSILCSVGSYQTLHCKSFSSAQHAMKAAVSSGPERLALRQEVPRSAS